MRHLRLCLLFTLAVLSLTAADALAQATDVNVTNPTSDPAVVQPQSDSLPFVYTVTMDLLDQQKSKEMLFTGLTPAGYYLIVDHISVFAVMPVGQRCWATAKAFDPTKPATLQGFTMLPMLFQATDKLSNGTPTGDIYATNTGVSLFVPYAWNLRVNVIRNGYDGTGYAYATIQGHFAKVPAIARGQ